MGKRMEADWEVEVGGGAPAIDALWPGFVDLRLSPERIGEIAEAAAFPALAALLLKLNSPGSPVWTAKCDLWEPDGADRGPEADGAATELALYIDLLPRPGQVFSHWQLAACFCQEWAARLAAVEAPQCRSELIVRLVVAGAEEGYGVTAYLCAQGRDRPAAAAALSNALPAFADAIPAALPPAAAASKLQWKSVGE